jgi:hypothetical protein
LAYPDDGALDCWAWHVGFVFCAEGLVVFCGSCCGVVGSDACEEYDEGGDEDADDEASVPCDLFFVFDVFAFALSSDFDADGGGGSARCLFSLCPFVRVHDDLLISGVRGPYSWW